MARVGVERIDSDTFEVVVAEDGSSTAHTVSASDAESVVEASFRFLLDREPKESIMRRFDLTIIGRYFPDYRDGLGEYLRRG